MVCTVWYKCYTFEYINYCIVFKVYQSLICRNKVYQTLYASTISTHRNWLVNLFESNGIWFTTSKKRWIYISMNIYIYSAWIYLCGYIHILRWHIIIIFHILCTLRWAYVHSCSLSLWIYIVHEYISVNIFSSICLCLFMFIHTRYVLVIVFHFNSLFITQKQCCKVWPQK